MMNPDKGRCTIEDIAARIEEIRAVINDDERAHGMEDALRDDVLAAIAHGAPNAAHLATAVRETARLEFQRWCA